MNASGVQSEQARRRDFPLLQGQWLLFDPQLYLSNLDITKCEKTCGKLATYSWFGMQAPAFDSREETEREWFKRVKAELKWSPTIPSSSAETQLVIRDCLHYQSAMGVTHFICPSPLAADPADGFQEQVKWMDAAIPLRASFGRPLLATLAVSDYLLSETEPPLNEPLQGVLDSIATRELDGLYVLVVQDSAPSCRITQRRLAESLLYISYIVGTLSGKIVIVNFADDLGYACVSLGAEAYADGWTNKQRRLSISDFTDREGGWALPRLYSHSLAGDFLTERDLSKLRDADLLYLLDKDVTEASRPLLSALGKGASAKDIPTWRESRNNVGEAAVHRVARLQQAIEGLRTATTKDRRQEGLNWLRGAEAGMALVLRKLSPKPPEEDGRHVPEWTRCYRTVLGLAESTEGN
jgi:hypothetical protein